MRCKGTLKGRIIELDKPILWAEGTPVEVEIKLEARKSSPQALLALVGTLTEEEAELIREAVKECRRIDWEMWKQDTETTTEERDA